MADTWNLTPWDVSRRAGLAAAHTTSGRQGLTHGLNDSPPQTGQPISQPAILSYPRDGTKSRRAMLTRGRTRSPRGDRQKLSA